MASSSLRTSEEATAPFLTNSDFGGLLHLVAAASALTQLDRSTSQPSANINVTSGEDGEEQGKESSLESGCDNAKEEKEQPQEKPEQHQQHEPKRVVSDDESASDFEKSLCSPPPSPGGSSARRSSKKQRRSQRSVSSEPPLQSSATSVCDASVGVVSTVSESSGESSATVANMMNKPFPQRLMHILSEASLAEIITWLPHGRAFVVLQPNVFAEKVLPVYIPDQQSVVPAIGGVVTHSNATPPKYPSFTRKLNRWGFRQICRGPDAGAFHHPLFRRDEPELCHSMECQKSRRSRSSMSSKADIGSPKGVEGPICNADVTACASNTKVEGASHKKRPCQDGAEDPPSTEGSPVPLLPAATSVTKPLPPKKRRMISLDTSSEASSSDPMKMEVVATPVQEQHHQQETRDLASTPTPATTTVVPTFVQHAPQPSAPLATGVTATQQQVTLMTSTLPSSGAVAGLPLTNAAVAIPAPTAAPLPAVATVAAPPPGTAVTAAPAAPVVSTTPISIAPAQAPTHGALPQQQMNSLLTVLEQSRLAAQMFYNQQPLSTVALAPVPGPSPAPAGIVLNQVPTMWPVSKQPQSHPPSSDSLKMAVLPLMPTPPTQQLNTDLNLNTRGGAPTNEALSLTSATQKSQLGASTISAVPARQETTTGAPSKESEAMTTLPTTLLSSSTPSIKDALAQLRAEHAKSMLRRAFEDARARDQRK